MNHFERALQIDANYPLAEAGLAMAAGTFSVRFAYEQQAANWGRRAEEHASRALKQDANLAEAHLALASAAGTLYRNFDWPTVIREAQVALTLNPNLDVAHSALARAFYHVGLLDWSEAESRRAEETSGGTNVEVSRVHLYNQLLGGHFDEARRMAETLDKTTNAPVIRQYLGLASFYLGDRARAEDLLAKVRRPDGRLDTQSQASLAGVLAANGRRDEAEKTIRAVVDSGYMDHHVAYSLGAAEAQLRHPAEAVKWLRSAAETGFPCYQWMVRDSLLDPIRSEAGFQAFLASAARGLRPRTDAVPSRLAPALTALHLQMRRNVKNSLTDELAGRLMPDRPPTQDVTGLLQQWRAGNADALERLLPLVYNELRRVARARLRQEQPGHTLQATALVHEAYLRLIGSRNLRPQNRAHLFAVAARLMREILVDHARRKAARKRGGSATMIALDEAVAAPEVAKIDLLVLDEALTSCTRSIRVSAASLS